MRRRQRRRPGTLPRGSTLLLLLLALHLVTGCSRHYRQLSSATQIPDLAVLESEARSRPASVSYVEVQGPDEPVIRIALEETGRGSTDRLVVLLHGLLSDRRTWRFVVGDLGRDHRVLLVDLPGCGASSKPDPRELGEDGYSPTAQARRVLESLRWRLHQPDPPERLTVVGHSLGGAVILRMLGDRRLRARYGEVLRRIDRVVLIAPLDFALEKAHPAFLAVAGLGRTEVEIGEALGILRQRTALLTARGSNDPARAPREEADRLREILREKGTRRAARAMIRQAVPFHVKEKRPDWRAIERLVADYERVREPVLILWGARDETLPTSMGYKLQAQLPSAWLRVVERSMHSLQVERPGLTSDLIRSFSAEAGEGWEETLKVTPLAPSERVKTFRLAARGGD